MRSDVSLSAVIWIAKRIYLFLSVMSFGRDDGYGDNLFLNGVDQSVKFVDSSAPVV